MAVRLSPVIEVDALGFDLDHTLGFDDRLELRTMLRYAREAAASHGTAVREHASALLALARAGQLTIDQAVAIFLGAYLPASRAQAEVVRWREEVVAEALVGMRPAPGALACIKRLEARGIPVAILTNGWSPLQEAKAQSLGLSHLPMLISEQIGALKPAPEAFAALVGQLGTRRERTAYVGDDLDDDVLGAHAAALVPIWVPERDPAEADLRALPEGVVTMRTLEELAP